MSAKVKKRLLKSVEKLDEIGLTIIQRMLIAKLRQQTPPWEDQPTTGAPRKPRTIPKTTGIKSLHGVVPRTPPPPPDPESFTPVTESNVIQPMLKEETEYDEVEALIRDLIGNYSLDPDKVFEGIKGDSAKLKRGRRALKQYREYYNKAVGTVGTADNMKGYNKLVKMCNKFVDVAAETERVTRIENKTQILAALYAQNQMKDLLVTDSR